MDQRNLILAIVISAAIYIGFYFLYEKPRLEQLQAQQQAAQEAQQAQQQQQQQQQQTQQPAPGAEQPGTTAVPGTTTTPAAPVLVDRAAALKQSPRVAIDSLRLTGSIALKGGRLDDIVLVNYRETVDPRSPNIVLLSPSAAPNGYFAEFGWTGTGTEIPTDATVWRADGDKLTPDRPVTLTWENGKGVRFRRVFNLDRDYMFTVTQKVENSGPDPLTLHPYGRVFRAGTPEIGISQILQEGPIGVFGNPPENEKYILADKQYHDLPEDYQDLAYVNGTLRSPDGCHVDYQFESRGGWVGINDKYWLVALVPSQTQTLRACMRWERRTSDGKDIYQVNYLGTPVSVAPSNSVESTASLFAGAKEVSLIDAYESDYAGVGIPLFDRAVDFRSYFGALGFILTAIAKPLFYLLDLIYSAVGNFGVAIMLLTVLVKLAFLWLANKSYRAMNKMKKLAPLMQELRQRFGEDKARLNQEMMALYKREKVNPAAGCLPILVQIPVFIALYQVLYVTIEMRHAPFFGWVRDLSAGDPTSILNLFGLLPWAVPHGAQGFLSAWGLDAVPLLGDLIATVLSLLSIGVWPLVMGVTMFLQQKMNPPPPDPVQAKIFMFLPIMFTFMLAPFAAGLVIYWAWNNLLSIAQQWLLKRLDERREAQAAAKRALEKPQKQRRQEEKPEDEPEEAKQPETQEEEEPKKPKKPDKPRRPEKPEKRI